MAKLLPSSSDVPPTSDAGPRVVGLDSEDADAVIGALKSETARKLLSELHEQPDSASALADRVDTSLQNTQYHLTNLKDAELIEVVDTVYSEKGREMDVYAPADEPLVLFGSSEPESDGLRAALTSLLGGIGVLAIGSLAVQWLADVWGVDDAAVDEIEPTAAPVEEEEFHFAEEDDDVDVAEDDDVADEPPTEQEEVEEEPVEEEPVEEPAPAEDDIDEPAEPEADPSIEEVDDAAPTEEAIGWVSELFSPIVDLEPGVVFFLGGLVMLVTIVAIQYVQWRRS